MRILLLLLLFAAAAAAHAEGAYKWTDEQGNVHYGDRPPADLQSKEYLELPAQTPEPTGLRPGERALLNKIERQQAAEAAAREQAQSEQAEQAAKDAQARARACQRYRASWEEINTPYKRDVKARTDRRYARDIFYRSKLNEFRRGMEQFCD